MATLCDCSLRHALYNLVARAGDYKEVMRVKGSQKEFQRAEHIKRFTSKSTRRVRLRTRERGRGIEGVREGGGKGE